MMIYDQLHRNILISTLLSVTTHLQEVTTEVLISAALYLIF
jgi:hypothetical protein